MRAVLPSGQEVFGSQNSFSTALYFCILRFSNLAHHKKKNTEGHNGLVFTVLPAYLLRWRYEVHIADNTSVDSSVELAVYGLCQRHQKRRAASKDAVAAVKRSIHSLSLVAHTFISNTAGVLMRMGGIVIACRPHPPMAADWTRRLWKALQNFPYKSDGPGALMLRRCY